jgi:hypothetical protein
MKYFKHQKFTFSLSKCSSFRAKQNNHLDLFRPRLSASIDHVLRYNGRVQKGNWYRLTECDVSRTQHTRFHVSINKTIVSTLLRVSSSRYKVICVLDGLLPYKLRNSDSIWGRRKIPSLLQRVLASPRTNSATYSTGAGWSSSTN